MANSIISTLEVANSNISDENSTDFDILTGSPVFEFSTISVSVLYIIIFLIAVTGNTLVFATLVQQRHMRTVTNTMLLNLSLVDLLLVFICMPVTLCGYILKNFIFPEIICPIAFFFQGISVFHFGLFNWYILKSCI